jgi:ADP-ribosylglycohydrolase
MDGQLSQRHDDRLAAARRSLEGLSVGDAFGEGFFGRTEQVLSRIEFRALPKAPWRYTDDTVMAISIVDVLTESQNVDPDRLADLFTRRYRYDPRRGYGGTAHEVLANISSGCPWAEAASQPFDGTGSMGNGAAMRVPPIGAYFAPDYRAVVDAVRTSAAVTHAHPDGQAGAIAVAVAAAWVTRGAGRASDLFETVLEYTPDGDTRSGIARAARVSLSTHVRNAASTLGNGSRVISSDTVPYCLWCVARHLDQYEEALWATVSGLGDRDTTCAIVGGIVAMHPNAEIPREWLDAREPLENMGRDKLAF